MRGEPGWGDCNVVGSPRLLSVSQTVPSLGGSTPWGPLSPVATTFGGVWMTGEVVLPARSPAVGRAVRQGIVGPESGAAAPPFSAAA